MTLSDTARAINVLVDAVEEEDEAMKHAAQQVLFHMRKKELFVLAIKKLTGELK